MADDKTEVEFAGVKFRGGKIFILITALSTLGGGLYAGFEFYNDYRNMKKQIQSYVAPDLSSIRKELAVLKTTVEEGTGYTRDIKNDLKKDISRIERQVDKRREQTRSDMNNLETRLKSDMKQLKDSVNNKITKALNNPLAGMRGK